MSPFDFVKDIQGPKKDLVRTSDSSPEEALKVYHPWVINRAMSFYVDSILYANEVNMNPHIDRLMQHDYYLHSIRSMRRSHSWIKTVEPTEDVRAVMEYMGISSNRAKEYVRVLTPDQLHEIKTRTLKGG
jgi:hypothetical protein